MRIKTSIVALGLLLAAGNAFAFHCGDEMTKIDKALAANPALSAERLAEVKKFRSEGEFLHQLGRHEEALDTLGKATDILNIK